MLIMKTFSKLLLAAFFLFSMVAIKAQQIPEIEMVKVEGGEFLMGSYGEQRQDCERNTLPAHRVILNDYYVAKYEVTQELWMAVMGGKNPSKIIGDKLPVTRVTWYEAKEFIAKLNKLTGKNYRLLFEAEWEYAARGGKYGHDFRFSGSDNIDEVAWNRKNSGKVPHAVGTKQPNELGIYDMSGNVYEWCEDGYEIYELSTSNGSQLNEIYNNTKVYRGGCMTSFWDVCQVTARNCAPAVYKYVFVGFRLAMDGE